MKRLRRAGLSQFHQAKAGFAINAARDGNAQAASRPAVEALHPADSKPAQ
jgi:hypothetical protein